MSQPERPPQPMYLRAASSPDVRGGGGGGGVLHPVDPVDPQQAFSEEVRRKLVTEGRWSAPEVDYESPGVTDDDFLEVLARRLTGPATMPSGEMVLDAEVTSEGVVVRRTTWGPRGDRPVGVDRERHVTHYLLKLEELP